MDVETNPYQDQLDRAMYAPPKGCPYCLQTNVQRDWDYPIKSYYYCPDCGTCFYLRKTAIGLSQKGREALDKALNEVTDSVWKV